MTENRKRTPVPVARPIPIEETKATTAERVAAIAALFEMAKREGWRSDRPYGPREELYDR